MRSLWNDSEAKTFINDPVALRVYTSRLLGKDPDLVLHGGGNTSVKVSERNVYGQQEQVLYIKGSGWDLATIERAGFAPVKMDALLKMATFPTLTDSQMVFHQRAAMTDPYAPNPSVEAILHALIPFTFVDHTHADAVVTVSNSPDGPERIRQIYGEHVLCVPYVMPGFILAREVYEMTRRMDWKKCEGIVLLHHGIFTFDNDARKSYEKMIRLVSKAEQYLKSKKAWTFAVSTQKKTNPDLKILARSRWEVSQLRGTPMVAKFNDSPLNRYFSSLPKTKTIATQGPLTPDHIIRTKRIPVLIDRKPDADVASFADNYRRYFKKHAKVFHKILDAAPRWAVWLGQGTISFGENVKAMSIAADIVDHTVPAILRAEKLGGWKALSEQDMFEMEYWELEQAKLKKSSGQPVLAGKIAVVTGAASGIGRACVERLHANGAAVAALDINPEIKKMFKQQGIIGIPCDVTDRVSLHRAVEITVREFGGVDIVVSNAGVFPPSERIDVMNESTWEKSLKINLTSHEFLIQEAVPYLSLGIDPTVIIMGSKNVPAPGPGVAAYSVAKAGLTQLARVAALELASSGIRVNVIHPNQVFDTAIWTKEVLEKRAAHYRMSVADYKKSNLLKTEITSKDVAELVCAMAGPVFAKTTGAQIPIDGGNDRVI